MSKQMKLECCLLSIDLNQLITAVVLFHWLKLRFFAIVRLIRSRNFFSDFAYLELRGVDESALSVMNASLSAVVSTLSSIPNFVAMSLFSLWIACVVSGSAFS